MGAAHDFSSRSFNTSEIVILNIVLQHFNKVNPSWLLQILQKNNIHFSLKSPHFFNLFLGVAARSWCQNQTFLSPYLSIQKYSVSTQ